MSSTSCCLQTATRRSMLDSLREAHQTIASQVHRVSDAEIALKKSASIADEYAFRQREYLRQIQSLETELNRAHERLMEYAETKERMQVAIEVIEADAAELREANRRLQEENRKQLKEMGLYAETARRFDNENQQQRLVKNHIETDLRLQRDSADIIAGRVEHLEETCLSHMSEVKALRREKMTLSVEVTEARRQCIEVQRQRDEVKEENESLLRTTRTLTYERQQQVTQLSELSDQVAQLHISISSSAADKERVFHDTLQLRQQLQNVDAENDKLRQENAALHDQVSELENEVLELRRQLEWRLKDSAQTDLDLGAVLQADEALATELGATKDSLDQMRSENGCIQRSVHDAWQHNYQLQQQIDSLQRHLDSNIELTDTLQSNRLTDMSVLQDEVDSMKREIRQLAAENTTLELDLRELETQRSEADRIHSTLLNSSETGQSLWKDAADRLTETLTEKQREMEELRSHVVRLEDQVNVFKSAEITHQNQSKDLIETRQRVMRLEDDNRRLQQQDVENRKMITVLEMQKNVLVKMNRSSKISDMT